MIPTPRMKIERIHQIALENGWAGILSEETDHRTILAILRNDEALAVEWKDETFSGAKYYMFDRLEKLDTLQEVGGKIRGWPNLMLLFKLFPNANGPTLSETYRRLPFADDAPNEEILSKLVGHVIFWYSRLDEKIRSDVVMPVKGNKKESYRIVDMGHRKLLHFNGARDGFTSIHIDQILQVME